jgi:glycosyltransferase involved in cell wall biosynthesis
MNVLVLAPYLHDTAPCQRFRIEQWARILAPLGVRVHFVAFESLELKQILYAVGHHAQKIKELWRCIRRRARVVTSVDNRWDVIFLHRELLPVGPPVLEWILGRKDIPIVYDFDDAIFLPNVSEANRRFQWLKWPQKTRTICRLSTHVIVGNRYLGNYAVQHARNVSVIPTTIDTDSYAPKKSVEISGRPVIGWSGSVTTVKHLETVGPVLRALKRLVDFRMKVVGVEGFSLPGLDVESKSWTARTEIEDLTSFDVGIMPLPDDAWSRGKCGLKALQYMALGVPTVASSIGVNREIIEDGENGFLATTEEEWVEKLSLLLSDKGLRARFAEEGRRTIEERYSAQSQARRVLEILEGIPPGAKASSSRGGSAIQTSEILE